MTGLWRDESGLTSVEYALLLTVLVAGAIIVWRGLGDTANSSVNRASDSFSDGAAPRPHRRRSDRITSTPAPLPVQRKRQRRTRRPPLPFPWISAVEGYCSLMGWFSDRSHLA